MGKLTFENGFARAAFLLLFLIALVIVGVLYLNRRRDVDVAEAGKSVVVDLEEAAEAVRDTSEDAFLTAKVKTALALSKSASAFDIKVVSDEGVVTLSGALPSSDDKEAVLEVARGTDGVLNVVDRIEVDPSAARLSDDAELAKRLADLKVESAVYERLLASEALDARRVRVTVQGGVVRLMGSVPDPSQKERVRELVESVPGVASVLNELEIQAPAAARSSS